MILSTDPMTLWKNYFLPNNLQAAVEIAANTPGSVRIIAGGTDLLLDLQQGRHPPVDALVDVSNVAEMQALETRGEDLFIGAAVPLNDIAESPLVREHAMALTEASGLVGGPQVRNTATLGGNVAHALPAADGTIALMSLDCRVELASKDGLRRIPLGNLFKGPGKSALDPRGDILVGFYVKLIKNWQASGFSRIMRPQGVALPILNMAIWMERSAEIILDVRIAVGPSGPTPQRITAAEEVLQGNALSPDMKARALDALLASVRFRSSPQRATADYRKHLASLLLNEVLDKAWQRTGDKVSAGV